MSSERFASGPKPPANEVDSLLERVAEIQASCEHDYENTGGIVLQESAVKGVYKVGWLGHVIEFTLTCVKCSEEKKVRANEMCPICVEPLEPNEPALSAKQYDRYWGRGLTSEAREVKCPECGLRLVYEC